MQTFKYAAISKGGQRVNGVVEAFDQMDAVNRIKHDCDIVLKLDEVKEGGLLSRQLDTKLNAKAFTMMCSQFAIILGAGIPVGRTVHLIAEKTTDKMLKKILTQVADDVEGGRSLAAAFEDRGGKLMPPTFVETLRAGEASGSMDRSFRSMYEHFDKQTKMRGKVRGALAYPIFVLTIAVVVVIVLMAKVVPVFTAMFAEYDTQLPLVTQMLISISNFFAKYYLLIIGVIAALGIFYKVYGNTETGRMRFALIQRELPVLGNVSVLSSASEFANSMAALLASGMPITRAVSITARVIDNYYVGQEVGKIAVRLEEGLSLVDCLREAQVLPDILTDMVGVGEETGEMEKTLTTVALYYDSELEMAVASAIAKLEPTLLLGLAVIAGFIVIAVYMAMFSLYGSM